MKNKFKYGVKMGKLIFSIMFLILFTNDLTLISQTKKSLNQKPATQTAKTTDGKTVILRPDGTWEYSKNQSKNACNLSIQAAVVLKSGDVKPMARNTFYLLDDDYTNIVREIPAGVTKYEDLETGAKGMMRVNNSNEYILAWFGLAQCVPNNNVFNEYIKDVFNKIKPHVISRIQMDFEGNATSESISFGTYYLIGVFITPKGGCIVWNLPLNLHSNEEKVIIDQFNSAYTSEW
jgi:hypothetical protein